MSERRNGSTDVLPAELRSLVSSGPTREAEGGSRADPRGFEPSFNRIIGDHSRAGDSLPPDLVRHASRRLLTIAIAISAAWLFLYLWVTFTPDQPTLLKPPRGREVLDAVTLAAMLGSAALVARVYGRSLSARQLFRTGLSYLLFIGLCAAINEHVALWGRPPRGWSATALLIILFPVVVPVAPRRAVLIGVLITGVDGLGLAVARLLGHPAVGLVRGLDLVRDNLSAMFLAYGVAYIIYGLGRELVSARRVGGYQLEVRLGEGGMGEVWRGSHAMLARPAAIKLIRSSVAAQIGSTNRDVLKRRFALEVQATASLRSPHTVAIYDFGMAQDGTLYYVMELLEGITLRELIRDRGRIGLGEAIPILRAAGAALDAAHAAGVAHRDFKPDNIFLNPRGEGWRVTLLDFGVAKLMAQDAEVGHRTATGASVGTPAYMSPEQVVGKAVDHRADIYAAGISLYEVVTGLHPFGSLRDAPLGDIFHAQRECVAPPMSQFMPKSTSSRVAHGLDMIFERACAKDRDERFQSARDMLEAMMVVLTPGSMSAGVGLG
ncbi:MAG: serine/threonine protein kinase [Myxococcales bacterium]|nr:serine/threonine protein kinase [Myxococcales bacterium]